MYRMHSIAVTLECRPAGVGTHLCGIHVWSLLSSSLRNQVRTEVLGASAAFEGEERWTVDKVSV